LQDLRLGKIDLHSHTVHSDGQRTPGELLAEAAEAGVAVLSVTDHDTVSGLAECARAALQAGVRLVAGIELSCELHAREVHILGHFIDPACPALCRLTAEMTGERRDRMVRMVARAAELKLSGVTLERVVAASGGETLGRPHLARVLIDQGHALSVKDAFDRYLRDGGLLYAERRRLSAEEGIALIHEAGGTASVAHPGANEVQRGELRILAELGLDAVEANHPEHVPTQVDAYTRWAEEHGLLITAGSDYHGPEVQPDRKLGDRWLAEDRFARLEERARNKERVTK
jgi:predicted metal-dependent phosphoesterase TrpH